MKISFQMLLVKTYENLIKIISVKKKFFFTIYYAIVLNRRNVFIAGENLKIWEKISM